MTQAQSVVHLSSRALIALGGVDWRDFLQGLITQDVETLAVGEIRFGGLLTPQGRLLFDLFVIGRQEGCWLDVATEHRASLIQRLTMYRLRAKVTIEADDTEVHAAWDEKPEDAWLPDPRLPALGWRGYYGYYYYGDSPLNSKTTSPPSEPGIKWTVTLISDETAYDAHRLTLGIPGPADWGTDKTYPIEANFDLLNGIDFQKGCFVGQETTSRMKRRGVIKTRMMPITFEGQAPDSGAEILNGDLRAGEILSVGEGRAMASLRLDRIGGQLTVNGQPIGVEQAAWLSDNAP